MKPIEKSKQSLLNVSMLSNVMNAIVRFLRSVHSDLRSSLSRLSLVLPMVLSILSALSILLTTIIQSHRLNEGLNEDARALVRMTDRDIEQSFRHISDPYKQAQATQSKKKQKEIAMQRVFRIGGNALLFMVYTLLTTLLIAFPGAFPFVLASIATSQIVSAARIGYAMYEKSHKERKFHEVVASMNPVPSIDDSKLGEKRFNEMLQDAVTNKIAMAVLNALTVGVMLSGVFFPPIAIAMNAMALILLGITISVAMHYQRQKKQAGKKIRHAYSVAKQTNIEVQSVSEITSTTKLQVEPTNIHHVTAETMQHTSAAYATRMRADDEKIRLMNKDTLSENKSTLVRFGIFQHVGNMILRAYQYYGRPRK